ncbi:MAG TPA: hypothetical protein PK267_04465, partial [Atribacterota bacterium]|nr:hypothetical protein [Atribacterota bacterium]
MNRDVIRRMVQVASTFLLQGLLLLVSSWTLKWSWAWLFVITQITILVINYLVLPRELMAERGGKKKNVKRWDKILMNIAIIPFFGAYILSGLDYRLKWSPALNSGVHISGLIILFLGTMLFTWSMVSN